MNSPRSLTNAAIRLVKNDRLQKPVQRCTIHNTACAAFVQGAFLKLSVNSVSSFKLKEEQKIAKNCLREGRSVFAVIPTGFGESFIFQLFSTVIEQEKISERLHPNIVILVICPFKSLIEDQIKERQSLGLSCPSLQDVNNLFDDNLPQLLFPSAEKALDNDFKRILKDRSSKIHQQVELIVVDNHTLWRSGRAKRLFADFKTQGFYNAYNV